MGQHFHTTKKLELEQYCETQMEKTLYAASLVKHETLNPETIEALAILRGVPLRMSQGIHILLVGSECMLVVAEINKAEATFSAWDNVIQELKRLQAGFNEIKF